MDNLECELYLVLVVHFGSIVHKPSLRKLNGSFGVINMKALRRSLVLLISLSFLENCFLEVKPAKTTKTNLWTHLILGLPSTLTSIASAPARAETDFEGGSTGLPDVAFSLLLVFVGISGALSWVASLKTRRFEDGQPRSTSLYRVFQARMRAGEFGELSKAGEKQEDETEVKQSDEESEKLDAFVDAYVDALEIEDPSADKPSTDSKV